MSFTVGSYPSGGLAIYRYFDVENLEVGVSPLEGQYINNEPLSNQQSAILSPASALLPGGSLLPGNLVAVDQSSANGANPNVARTQAATATGAPANALLGIVYGFPWLKYRPTNDAIPAGYMVSVLRGKFVARMDVNSFVVGQAPTALGQKIYMAIQDGTTAPKNLGLFSTTQSGTAANTDLALGEVVGFETVTGYGPQGMTQISADPTGTTTTAAPQVITGGVTLVRVQFDIPTIGKA